MMKINAKDLFIRNKTLFIILLSLFLAYDLCFSFAQYYQYPLDGDMATITLGYHETLADPFGFQVLFENKMYGGANRYFTHVILKTYFTYVPNLLQLFLSPIDSVYAACAIIKLLTQVMLVFSMGIIASQGAKLTSYRFLISACIGSVLFQTTALYHSMGLIDLATSYTFFYALSMAQLMIYIIPFNYKFYEHNKISQRTFIHVFLAFYAIFLAFNGPLVAPVVLIYGATFFATKLTLNL